MIFSDERSSLWIASIFLLVCPTLPVLAADCPPGTLTSAEHLAKAKESASYYDCLMAISKSMVDSCGALPTEMNKMVTWRMCVQDGIIFQDFATAAKSYHEFSDKCAATGMEADCNAKKDATERLEKAASQLPGG